MLNRFIAILGVIIALLSLLTTGFFLGISITGNTTKGLNESITSISFIIAELIIFTFIILIIDVIRFKKKRMKMPS